MSSSPVVDRVDQATEAPLPVSHQPSPAPFEGQASMDTSWLDPTTQAALGFPFTPMSSTYNGGQSAQPGIPKATSQVQNDLKPLFTWSSQTFGQNAGNYRDYSQPTPSTASSLFYRQTPVSTESFLTAPSLTPLTGNVSDNSYTGVSPGFSYLDVNADGNITGSAPRRPAPIRHLSTNSVGTLSRPSPYGHSISAWPYSYSGPGPVPPPMTNNFTLSQPPFSTRRPPTEPLPMYPPEQYQSTRRLHPSPGMRSAHSPFRSAHYSIPAGRGGHHRHASLGQEAKPPRFKPTAEQKAILIETYETNPNPDGPTRESLARRLGPDIKPKTLQIWFQNRRSKSKTKEQAASLPKPLNTAESGHRRSASREIDMNALKLLTRSEDPNMILLPITVLAFTTWRRISTPGSCTPDLGASLHLVPSPDIHPSEQFIPHLHLYTVQAGTTFRLTVYIDQDSMGQEPVHMSTNPNSDVSSVAVRLTIRPGKTLFAMWTGQAWTGALDFTEGMASGGGHCELTGKHGVIVPAFTQVARILSPGASEPVVESVPSLPVGWKFPTAPITSEPATMTAGNSFDDDILNPAYFDDAQPNSSGSSSMPTSTHSSMDHVQSIEQTITTNFNQVYGLAPDGYNEAPLDFSKWAGMDFQPPSSAQLNVGGDFTQDHHPTMSQSESDHTHSTEESSVNTPVLDALGLSLEDAVGEPVENPQSSGDGMNFGWY